MKQLLRYTGVGLAANLAGYLVYLALTYALLEPKIAMTLVYAFGVIVSYLGNARWTFAQAGYRLSTLLGYGVAHLCGYGLNYLLLYVFVDLYGYPHQLVQAAAIVIVAGFLFVVFKMIVFTAPATPSSNSRI